VISLDSCSDQLVLALADDDQIIALSRDSRGAFSYYNERAQGFPQHFGTPEEILLMRPDLVLSTGAGDPGLALMLEDLGIRVISTGLPATIEQALEDLEFVGEVLGQAEKAQTLKAKTTATLEDLKAGGRLEQDALYLSPSGITTGSGTFLHQTIELAGLNNLLADEGIKGWSSFVVEQFIQLSPDVLITSFFDSRVGNAESWRFAGHPAMREAMKGVRVVDIPSRYLSCPAWFAVEGAALIRHKLEEAIRETAP
jgi:iron complex transport system substrate-binding protein